ncbi:uncharacterized protein LOC123263040 [Cotesia glomerata]|uniref:BZIP domain-containing protein n=1 Tax=Cotesia glomerata TaxID=32391 RepID=A0AAV7IVE1_COTGL|nr:uncharacterized protein LOC123263040 [Cotesia glomerata]XP_044581498.1 uncharacterized protein LOC123263040 [Cotesia glomerata]KAH0555607.1 hypothetical protein KQX54_020355 [Cotesia glomerata]
MGDSFQEFVLNDLNSSQMNNLIKQEPSGLEVTSASASVPIPGSHRGVRGIYEQFSPSPLTLPSMWGCRVEPEDYSIDPEQLGITFKMEDDDIFQVDKADLIQGPTLAELNANDDILLGDLNFDDLLLPEERMQPVSPQTVVPQIPVPLAPAPPVLGSNVGLLTTGISGFAASYPSGTITFKPSTTYSTNFAGTFDNEVVYVSPSASHIAESMDSCYDIGSSTASSSTSPHMVPTNVNITVDNPTMNNKPITVGPTSTLHELLMRKVESNTMTPIKRVDPVPMDIVNNSKIKVSRLSMSAPTQSLGLEQIWARREPRRHLLSTSSIGVAEAESMSSLSTGGALSPDPQIDPLGQLDPLSHDEGYEDSDDDSDHYDDYSSDNDSGSDGEDHSSIRDSRDPTASSSGPSKMSKKEKYFWQYNVQAKGPKGQRLIAHKRLEDPHVLNQATDPVFSPSCSLRGIKHSGKARKGDGNDLTPNPRKLYIIGKELDKLSRIINDMTPVSELPFPARPKTRKEKNKLASRACRLKKKAQHEANKIKLHGLEIEHKRLINGIAQIKTILAVKLTEQSSEKQEELTRQMDKICKSSTKIRIANHSTEFVNKILDKIKSGVPDGGIDDF